MGIYIFIHNLIDTFEDIFDDCLPRLPSWVVDRFHNSLAIHVHAADRALTVIPRFDCEL
jgi:hypothetical protein